MDKVQEPSNSEWNTPSSEFFIIYYFCSIPRTSYYAGKIYTLRIITKPKELFIHLGIRQHMTLQRTQCIAHSWYVLSSKEHIHGCQTESSLFSTNVIFRNILSITSLFWGRHKSIHKLRNAWKVYWTFSCKTSTNVMCAHPPYIKPTKAVNEGRCNLAWRQFYTMK
jgi:hypothetical protein